MDLSLPPLSELRAGAVGAGGVDPYAEADKLARAQPGVIGSFAGTFTRAGGEVDRAWTQSMSAQRRIGAGFTNNHQPVYDESTHLASLPAGFRDAGTQLVDSGRRITAVAGDLVATAKNAATTVEVLTTALRQTQDVWDARINGLGQLTDDQITELKGQREQVVAGMVSQIAQAGGKVRAGIGAYEQTIRAAISMLADQGHVEAGELANLAAPEGAPVYAGGLDPLTLGVPGGAGWAADPVNTGTGNFLEIETDLAFPGLLAGLAWRRVYNSRDERDRGAGFGPRWASWASTRLITDAGGAWWRGPDGQRGYFARTATGGFVPTPGIDAVVTEDGRSLCWFDGRRVEFDGAGRPAAATAGPGTEITFTHDQAGQLVAMTHAGGRSISFTWEGERITSAAASDGRAIDYGFDGRGRLVRAGERRYGIDLDGMLATVVDADGVVEVVNTYDEHGRVVAQRTPFGRLVGFRYLPGQVTVVGDDAGGPDNTYLHDEAGRLIGVIDGHGHTQRLERDTAGRIVRVVERGGAVTTSDWDARGRLVRRVLPTGVTTESAYDLDDRLVGVTVTAAGGGDTARIRYRYGGAERIPCEITDPGGGTTTLDVAGGLVHRVVDPDGVALRLGYDPDGALIAVTDADDAVATIDRDPAGQPTAVTTPDGHRSTYRHDQRGLLVERRDPDGAVWRYTYTAAGRCSAVIDPLGAATETRYGEHGLPTGWADPLGHTSAARFDPFGNLEAATAADGAKTTFVHDALSRLTAWTDPAGGTWLRSHDLEGRLVGATDPAGVHSSATFDPAGQVTAVHDGMASATFDYDGYGRTIAHTRPDHTARTVGYDRCGRVLTDTAPDGGTAQHHYTPAGRLRRTVSGAGRVTTYTYDRCGRLAQTVDGTGQRWTRRYHPGGALAARISPTGLTESFTYDTCGRLARVTAPAVAPTEHTYDPCGRLIAVTDGNGTRRFVRDPAGRVVEAVDALGHTTGYTYDPAGRVVAVTDPLGHVTRYDHDANGRVTAVTDPLGRTTGYAYDPAGRLTARVNAAGQTVRYRHDAAGRVCSIGGDVEITIERDQLGRPVRITEPGQETITLGYDPAGRLTARNAQRWTYDLDGLRTSRDGVGYDRDGAGRTTRLTHPLLGAVTITRDADGRLVGLHADGMSAGRRYLDGALTSHQTGTGVTFLARDAAGRITEIDHHRRYTYDPAGQLVAAAPDRTYTYDPCGRLTRETSGTRERRYTYDPAGQLTAAGPDRFTYDPAGRRITESGGRRYHWDALDRLTAIDTPTHTTTLHVDALGELTAIDTIPLTWDTADPYSPLTSLDGHTISGEGTPWAVDDTWLAPDWQHSIGASPDADPWGGAGTAPRLGFRGELALDGLVWLRHRAYDPATRSFLTPDPLPAVPATPHAANPYHYAGNDPVNHHDPLGLRPATDADLAAQKDDGGFWGGVGHFFHDNWQYVVGGALVVGGIALAATGVGAPLGLALEAAAVDTLISAGVSMIDQKATTGQVSLDKTLLDGTLGGVTGGLGAEALSLTRLGAATTDFLPGATTNSLQSAQTVADGLLRKGGTTANDFMDRVVATQGPRDVGSALPKSFNLTGPAGNDVWVAPNATKHIWEETRSLTFGRNIAEQGRLTGLADAVDNSVVGRWGNMQTSRSWELIYSEPRDAGLNPVLKHARYLGDN